jgi:Uma2 family endonuclease
VATEPKLMTAEELLALPDDGLRHELIDGVITTMVPPGAEHGGLESTVTGHLFVHLTRQPSGRLVAGETGFRLRRDPDLVRGADVAFIRAERVPAGGLPAGYFEGAPDLAIEIVSPNDGAAEVEEKVQQWLDGGASAVWVIYPTGSRLRAHRPDRTARTYHADDEVDGGDVLPGFRMRLADLLRPPGA